MKQRHLLRSPSPNSSITLYLTCRTIATRPFFPEPNRGSESLQDARHSNRSKDAGDGSQRQHQAHHDTSEVPRESPVNYHENGAVGWTLIQEP